MKTNIAPDLMAAFEGCKPGQSKPYAVTATMGADGAVTLSLDSSDDEGAEPAAPPPAKKGKKSPVKDAIDSMYA